MQERRFRIGEIPAVVYGGDSDKGWLFVHGKNGCKEDALPFAELAVPAGGQVLSVDLPEHGERKAEQGTFNPWTAVPELNGVIAFMQSRYKRLFLRANSIGAWFSMQTANGAAFEQAAFVSPVVNMQNLIERMMSWAGVSADDLQKRGEIPTAFGETLSWRYYVYARNHSLTDWTVPTAILCGERDDLILQEEFKAFAEKFGAELTVAPVAEHWFHTAEQLALLKSWEKRMLP